jgi:hypothetical protein
LKEPDSFREYRQPVSIAFPAPPTTSPENKTPTQEMAYVNNAKHDTPNAAFKKVTSGKNAHSQQSTNAGIAAITPLIIIGFASFGTVLARYFNIPRNARSTACSITSTPFCVNQVSEHFLGSGAASCGVDYLPP